MVVDRDAAGGLREGGGRGPGLGAVGLLLIAGGEDSRRRPVHRGEVDLRREVPGERLRLLDVVVDLLLQHLPPNVLRLQFGLLQLLQEVRLERWESKRLYYREPFSIFSVLAEHD